MELIKSVHRYCHKCEKKMLVRLVRNITQSGVSQVYWYCLIGQHPIGNSNNSAAFIKHDKLKEFGVDPNSLPVIENYSGREVCGVCGSPFTELNHWAPKAIFGPDEAERWPKGYLCKKHHDIWNAKVTPNIAGVRKL